LVARWILVWDGKERQEPESVCNTHCPKIHAPTFKPKESVAWKIDQEQEPFVTLRWTSTSTIVLWQE